MYKTPIMHDGIMPVENAPLEGETIENKVVRILANKEPIKDGAPVIYTDRKDGVNPAYNIRTDRWEIAADAMDRILKMKIAKAEDKGLEKDQKEAKTIDIDKNKDKEKSA